MMSRLLLAITLCAVAVCAHRRPELSLSMLKQNIGDWEIEYVDWADLGIGTCMDCGDKCKQTALAACIVGCLPCYPCCCLANCIPDHWAGYLAAKVPKDVKEAMAKAGNPLPHDHIIIFTHLMGRVGHVRVYTDWNGGADRIKKMRKVQSVKKPTHKFWDGETLTVRNFHDWAYNYERKEFKAPGKGESSRECHRYITFVINDFAGAGDDKWYKVPCGCDKPVCCTPDKIEPTKVNGKGMWISPATIKQYRSNKINEMQKPKKSDSEKKEEEDKAEKEAAQKKQEEEERKAREAELKRIEEEQKKIEEQRKELERKARIAKEEAAKRLAEQQRLMEEERIFYNYVYGAIVFVLALSGALVYFLFSQEKKEEKVSDSESDIESQIQTTCCAVERVSKDSIVIVGDSSSDESSVENIAL